jgi:hypothetical protein
MPIETAREKAQEALAQIAPYEYGVIQLKLPGREGFEVRVTTRGLMVVRLANDRPVRYFHSLKTVDGGGE